MTEELKNALDMLKSDRVITLAVVKNGEKRIFTARGVKPLLELATTTPDFLEGASVADKVTGAASAFILAQGKAKELYTDVISERAAEILTQHGIHYIAATTVGQIVNRQGDGGCPLEAAVKEISDPQAAVKAISKKLTDLSDGSGKS